MTFFAATYSVLHERSSLYEAADLPRMLAQLRMNPRDTEALRIVLGELGRRRSALPREVGIALRAVPLDELPELLASLPPQQGEAAMRSLWQQSPEPPVSMVVPFTTLVTEIGPPVAAQVVDAMEGEFVAAIQGGLQPQALQAAARDFFRYEPNVHFRLYGALDNENVYRFVATVMQTAEPGAFDFRSARPRVSPRSAHFYYHDYISKMAQLAANNTQLEAILNSGTSETIADVRGVLRDMLENAEAYGQGEHQHLIEQITAAVNYASAPDGNFDPYTPWHVGSFEATPYERVNLAGESTLFTAEIVGRFTLRELIHHIDTIDVGRQDVEPKADELEWRALMQGAGDAVEAQDYDRLPDELEDYRIETFLKIVGTIDFSDVEDYGSPEIRMEVEAEGPSGVLNDHLDDMLDEIQVGPDVEASSGSMEFRLEDQEDGIDAMQTYFNLLRTWYTASY